MLRQDQIDRISDAIAAGWTMVAGDAVTHVTASGTQTQLLTVKVDVSANNKYSEGLSVDNAGVMLDEAMELTFLSSYLASKHVTLDVTDHFLINSDRWDYVKEAPIMAFQVPIAGIHNIVTVYVRRAVEQIQSTAGSGSFTFE